MKHVVTEVSLSNGVKGLFVHIPDASVMTYEFNFRAGEYLVEPDLWETPHLMEHVLLGANQLIPKARAFQAEFEKNGAYCNASTGSYDITYEAECADFEWDRIADLLLIAITKPLFLEEEFQAESSNVREELTARSNNHFRHLSLALRGAYGFKSLTDQQRLQLMENVTLDHITAHYAATHTTKNLRFVIAGKLTKSRQKILEGLIENIELETGTSRIALPREQPVALDRPLYIHNDSVENIYFYLDTFKSARISDPQTDALSLINTMLTETLYSRILGTAREQGLVYSMSSGYGTTVHSSNWWFGAQIMPSNAPKLFDIMTRELTQVFEGKLDEADVASAKQYALGRYQRSGQTVSGTADGYSTRYFFDETIDDYYQIPKRIDAVSRDLIVSVSKNMFADEIWGLGCLGSAGESFAGELYAHAKALWDHQAIQSWPTTSGSESNTENVTPKE